MTQVDITLFLDVADQEPGVPQTVESLHEWLIPDLLAAVRRVIGYPGDYGATYANAGRNPRGTDYEVTIRED